MAKKIRFPLKMKNGAEVRTLDELKENFDLESVLGYFTDGKLTTWLADRYYDEKAEAVSALSADTPDLNATLCEILEVEYQGDENIADLEYIQHRNEKLRILSSFTDKKEILNNIDIVALSQNELFDILDEKPEKVYLYGDKYSIPFGAQNVCYIGVNNPVITLDKMKYVFEYNEVGISFKNVRYDEAVNPYITKGELLYIDNQYEEAFPLVKEAAEKGNPRAMYILAMMYKDNCTKHYYAIKLTKEWLNKAYSFGEPLSTANYAYFCCDSNPEKKKAILKTKAPELKKLADTGDTLAQFEYGAYLVSYSTIENDKSKGIDYMLICSSKCLCTASIVMGMYYENETILPKDCNKALEWYKKSYEQGNPQAPYEIARLYNDENLLGVDESMYAQWLDKAAEMGHAYALNLIGNQYYVGSCGRDKSYVIANRYYAQAMKNGYAWAAVNLANNYKKGKGFDSVNTEKAIELYKKAYELAVINEADDAKEEAESGLKEFGITI